MVGELDQAEIDIIKNNMRKKTGDINVKMNRCVVIVIKLYAELETWYRHSPSFQN